MAAPMVHTCEDSIGGRKRWLGMEAFSGTFWAAEDYCLSGMLLIRRSMHYRQAPAKLATGNGGL